MITLDSIINNTLKKQMRTASIFHHYIAQSHIENCLAVFLKSGTQIIKIKLQSRLKRDLYGTKNILTTQRILAAKYVSFISRILIEQNYVERKQLHGVDHTKPSWRSVISTYQIFINNYENQQTFLCC